MIVQMPGIQPEIAMQAIPDDERVWVPQAPGVWFRPLLLNTVTGSWCNLLRVRKAGVLSRHIHPSWVTGYVIRGAWRYLEHDWVAKEGSFVYEPPGEIHTLVVDEQVGATEMITFFNIHGAMVYVDDAGKVSGYEDVFTKIAMCRKHYWSAASARRTSIPWCADASPPGTPRLAARVRLRARLPPLRSRTTRESPRPQLNHLVHNALDRLVHRPFLSDPSVSREPP